MTESEAWKIIESLDIEVLEAIHTIVDCTFDIDTSDEHTYIIQELIDKKASE